MDMLPCGTGLENMTRHIHEFSNRIENLEIIPENDRARFALFRYSLTTNSSSDARTAWDKVFEARGEAPLTKERFTELGKEWIAHSAVEQDRDDQILYLRNVIKGPSTTVEEFQSNLILCNQLTDWLPGTAPVLTKDELRLTFFNGMPHLWITKFKESGQNVQKTRLQVILAYMRNCQKESNAKALKNMLKQQQKNPSNGGPGRGRNKDRTRYRNQKQNQRNVKPRHEASTVPFENRDENHKCYEHPDAQHLWKKCFLHPVNGAANKKEAQESRTQRTTNGGRGRGAGRGRGHSSHQQHSAQGAQSHLTQAQEIPSDEEEDGGYAFTTQAGNDPIVVDESAAASVAASSDAEQESTAPGWAAEVDERSVASRPRDNSLPPTRSELYQICQGDSPTNEHSYVFGNKKYKPAKEVFFPSINQQERDHLHDKRCENLCVPWQGKEPCYHSSFFSQTVHTKHSHHIAALTIQTASLQHSSKATSVSQLGTTHSATAMQNEQPSRILLSNIPKPQNKCRPTTLIWRKTCASIPKDSAPNNVNQKILYELSRQATKNEKHLLKDAVCNAV